MVLVTVETGPIKDNDIVIEAGLRGGESIIVEGVQKIRPGMTVDPQPYVSPVDRGALQAT